MPCAPFDGMASSSDPGRLLSPVASSSAMGERDGGLGGGPNLLLPVFIPRQPPAAAGSRPGFGCAPQLPPAVSSPTSSSLAASASADWAFLLRSATAHTSSGLPAGGSSPSNIVSGGRASPQLQLSSPTAGLLYSPMAGGGGGGALHAAPPGHASASGLGFLSGGHASLMSADTLGQLPGDGGSDLSGSACYTHALLHGGGGSGGLAPSALAALYGDGVQTLYPSNGGGAASAASASAALAAAGAAAAARATTAHSLLQQQAVAAAAAAAVGSHGGLAGGLASLSGGLNLTGLGRLEESLSGSLFGAGAAAAAGLSPKPMSASLYIKNLPADADKLFLYEKFSPYGAILSVKVLNDPASNQCRGVGFVNFAEHTSALRSIQALHGTKVGDKLLHVSLQTPRIRAAALPTL